MGYHVINIKQNELNHFYVETLIELSSHSEIRESSIIYQGEKH